MATPQLSDLSEVDRAALAAWVAEHGAWLPRQVRTVLEHYEALVACLAGSRYKQTQMVVELRRALGITAKSERKQSGDPLGPQPDGAPPRRKTKRGRLEQQVERLEVLSVWHKRLAKRHKRAGKAARRKLLKLPVEESDDELDEDDLSPEELAAIDALVVQQRERFELGGGEQAAFEPSREAFMTGAQVATEEEAVTLPAPYDEARDGKLLDTIVDQRQRFDFSFTVRRLAISVEKKVVRGADGERRVLSASTSELGPPRYAVTWEFLAHMPLLVVQYAMPMNRLATLLSTDAKRFTAGGLARMLVYVAQRFAPIYLTLYDALAHSPVLTGDDTDCRVIEVRRHFQRPSGESPWHGYRNGEAARSLIKRGDTSLGAMLAAELGFEFERRTGDGTKRALHTTTISGRADARDPRSLIVFYRSHLGSFGNLLETLLQDRNPKLRDITVQSDLAASNLVANAELKKKFAFTYVGCGSHARRPFALYEDEDPEHCSAMLHLFAGLFLHEQTLNTFGRNEQNVRAVRDVDSRVVWQDIKGLAEHMSQIWSRETKLGEGARYIVRNFAKLTAYLDDPRVELTNNFSERMLRLEKLIEKSSLFRTSLEGRFALDVLRTVLQTAVAARAPLQEYMLDVLRASPKDVAQDPARFTPLAWAAARAKTQAAAE